MRARCESGAGMLAHRLADEYETHDPFQLCRRLSVTVVRHALSGIRGYYTRSNGYHVVVVASALAAWPARYVCAHELGHCLLHSGLNRLFMDACTYMEPDRYENEADYFACQLLFSQPPLFAEQTLSLSQMAECLALPEPAVDSRLIEMGIFH